MKRPGLIQGIIVAVVLSLAAPALYHLCDLLVPRLLALKLVIVALTDAYVLYLLKLHHARIGNIVLGTGTTLILLAALLWGVATTTLVFVSITLIWIVRSLITTFSLKGELGWRKIAMSAYDEGSISVRGGEEGDACTHRSDPTEY